MLMICWRYAAVTLPAMIFRAMPARYDFDSADIFDIVAYVDIFFAILRLHHTLRYFYIFCADIFFAFAPALSLYVTRHNAPLYHAMFFLSLLFIIAAILCRLLCHVMLLHFLILP